LFVRGQCIKKQRRRWLPLVKGSEKKETFSGSGSKGGQGDQIGRIFTHWAIAYCLLWAVSYSRRCLNLGYFFHDKTYVLILTKSGLDYHLGETHLVTLVILPMLWQKYSYA
jgi:hypothetical protein